LKHKSIENTEQNSVFALKKQVKTLFLLSYDSTRRRRYYTFTSVCIIFEYFVFIA